MDDKKDAANISVGLSTQLINAALTLIVLSGAFLTFILDKKQPTPAFYISYGLAFIAFFISVIFGGKGIQFVKANGEKGDWKTKAPGVPNWFSRQSLFVMIGIFSISILPFLGNDKPDEALQNRLMYKMITRDSLMILDLQKLSGIK